MNKQHFTILIMLALAFIMSGLVIAGTKTDGSNVQSLWTSLDSNADGFLTAQEGEGSVTVLNNWNGIDVDKDNKISETEFKQFFTKQ